MLRVMTRDARTCVRQIAASLSDGPSTLLYWNTAVGLVALKEGGLAQTVADEVDEEEVVRQITGALSLLEEDRHDGSELSAHLREAGTGGRVTFILHGIEAFLEDSPELRRHLLEAAECARAAQALIVLLSYEDKFDLEMNDCISTLYHPLPDRAHSKEMLIEMLPQDIEIDTDKALTAVQGLTSTRQADAFSLGIVEALQSDRHVSIDILRRYKEEEIGKLDYLKVGEPQKTFDDIVGHGYLKGWLKRRQHGFSPRARDFALPVPKGVLFVGPPGTGKTMLVESIAHEWRCPFLTLDVGSVFAGLLGESEANITRAIEIAEKMSPCVLLVDEVERAFGDKRGGGDNDGGTTDRVIGKFLSWMSTKSAPVFVVFTSNEADLLPAALVRKGRVDEIFFVDFPSHQERVKIFDYYLSMGPGHVDCDPQHLGLVTEDWSGAEIEAAVGDARYTAFEDGERVVSQSDVLSEIGRCVPVSVSMSAKVHRMREWAKKYARPTEEKGRE
jgi:ATP-dependent 26S proteasome regulatory subunit